MSEQLEIDDATTHTDLGDRSLAQISMHPAAVGVGGGLHVTRFVDRPRKAAAMQTQESAGAALRRQECLGILAHELRSPLATICHAVEVLKMTGSSDVESRDLFDAIARQSGHMVHLIDDLLDVTRMLHEKIQIRHESVDVASVVRQANEACSPLFGARRQQVIVSLPTQNVPLSGDPTRLIQIFTNLLTNAAKYTDEGGHIWLTVTQRDGEVVVSVRDDGVGIDRELLPRVFDLFSQADGALERSQGGLGIGLAVVGHLVQLHGGTIHAASEGLGKGSEFVVRLPAEASAR